MRRRVFVVCLISCLLISLVCKLRSDVEEGLSYEEYINKAAQYLNEDKAEKAISYYKKALEIKPEDAQTHFVLGKIYKDEYHKSYDSALKKHTFDLLMQQNTNSKSYDADTKKLERYGLKSGYEEMAMQEFREAIKHDLKHWQARYFIATNYLNKKQFEAATEEFKKIIEINPKFNDSYSLMGEAYMELGSYDLAIDYLNAAIKLEPDFERNYYNLGLVYRKMNNGEKVNEMMAKLKSMNSLLYDDLRLALYRGIGKTTAK